ncbi:MAG: DUF389 domain-containing protein [Patescibacteria group bacterium]
MAPENTKVSEPLLKVTKANQYQTIGELFERSKPTSPYYALLVLSAVIVASGLLLDNLAVVIGGMLVTPVLTPVLVIALGLAVGNLKAVSHAIFLVGKSFLIILTSGALMVLLFGPATEQIIFNSTFESAWLYFIVAVASGVAATFAWVRKEIAEVLPGVAVAVALVPPLSLVGIWAVSGNVEAVKYFLLVFLFNFVGIILGSAIVFMLLKFYRSEERVTKKGEEQIKAEKKTVK